MRRSLWVWGSTLICAAVLFVACGGKGKSNYSGVPGTTVPTAALDVHVTAASFHNVHTMTKIGNHYVTNLLGNLRATLAVAHAGRGTYPVGTLIQIAPQEAMVKRRAGFSPSTGDWEFFSLDVSPQGTKILSRGGAQVLNRFGSSCAGCHSAAAAQFDFVCGHTHGCAPLPIGDAVFHALQEADPRPLH